jgi:hypothetical protein
MNKLLAKRLIAMQHADQSMRRAAIAGFSAWDHDLDHKQTEELKRMINRHGWPTISLVGEAASHAAWVLVQHADHDPDFQMCALKMMEDIRLVTPDDVSWHDVAYLTDRILVHNLKKPQWFGTQHYLNQKGKLVPFTIEDKKHVNKRRIEYGLETLAQNTRRLNREWKDLRG